MFGKDLGIDLGTANTLVYATGKGLILDEPSVVAVDTKTNDLLAVGEEAREMIGRTPANIQAIRPLKDGVIADFDVTAAMLKYFIQKSGGNSIFSKPGVVICVPTGATDVEKRAIIESAISAGSNEKRTYLIDEPLAAALGVGMDISSPKGCMIVDIGGGTSEVAVISLGGIVSSRSIRVAGDCFDNSIINFIKKHHNLVIGERTAEELKIEIGKACDETISLPHSDEDETAATEDHNNNYDEDGNYDNYDDTYENGYDEDERPINGSYDDDRYDDREEYYRNNYLEKAYYKDDNYDSDEYIEEKYENNTDKYYATEEEYFNDDDVKKVVNGRDLITGLPKAVEISSREVLAAISENIYDIVDAIKSTLESTPPELAADIMETGIILTGGGALLSGIDELISKETKMPVIVAPKPLKAVAIGTGKAIENIGSLRNTLISSKNARL
jgi:rod shape-determining protein MreB